MALIERAERVPGWTVAGVTFDQRELRDLALAWVALSLAFTLFLAPREYVRQLPLFVEQLGRLFAITVATVGTGFLLHEVAHKVVAIRYGQVAAFRADYGMLGLAIASGLAGFIFAAPGAVHHRGRITVRENGLIAVAGPVTNLALVFAFAPLLVLPGFLGSIGRLGVLINVFLAAFNMIPFGPLDGRTVLDWSRLVFGVVFAVSLAMGASALVLLL